MKRNLFNLSCYKLLSCDMGELIPVGWWEVVRGDVIRHSTSLLLRCSPLLSPVMHPVHVRLHHFFVPFRLLQTNWPDMITGGADGENTTVPAYMTSPASTGYAVGSLHDYLGVPTGIPDLRHSAHPARAYALIWNLFFRDQDLQTELTVSLGDGADTTTSVALQNCAWEKDYFTSARPWPQKGPGVTIPIGDEAPVLGIGFDTNMAYTSAGTGYKQSDGTDIPGSVSDVSIAQGNWAVAGNNATKVPDIYADLSAVSGIDVTDLREALAMQRFQEERSKFGSEYVDYLRYYGIVPSDSRLQRPEFLGGGRQTIQFSEVLQTAPTDDEPVGQLRGHGMSALRSNRVQRYYEEDGIMMTLMSVKPKTMYYQGLWKTWDRRSKEDYFQKEFAAIGQEVVKYKEVQAGHATPDGTFGYQDRYDELRRSESSIAGEFRTTELNYWHMARDLPTDTALNATFVKCVPTERTFAVPSNDVLWIMAKHHTKARRMIPATGKSFIY